MSPSRVADVRRLEFEVDFPPGHVAAYLVPGPEPVLFDAGSLGSDGEAALRSGLAEHGFDPADVAHVVLTHLHVDHVGQVGTLLAAGAPTLHVPTTVRKRLERDLAAVERTSRANMLAAGVPDDRVEDALEQFLRAQEIMRDVVSPSVVDEWIQPGTTTTVGDLDLEPVHTPGHDATHVCYRTTVEDEGLLFSGDMLIEPFRAILVNAGFDDGIADAVDDFLTALDRLSAVDADRVLPAHGPVHGDLADTVERDRSTLDARLAECEAALRESGSHAVHVANSLARDETGVARLLPETVAALAHLERTGRARSRTDDGVRYYAPS